MCLFRLRVHMAGTSAAMIERHDDAPDSEGATRILL
jgi:hypothetical protein